mgnify:CR=1 FL=1
MANRLGLTMSRPFDVVWNLLKEMSECEGLCGGVTLNGEGSLCDKCKAEMMGQQQ